MNSVVLTIVLAAPIVLLGSSPKCENLAIIALPNTTITIAESRTAGDFTPTGGKPIANLPAFCRIAGSIKPSSDSDIRFEVWLPSSNWNGKFQGIGNGGYAGSISFAGLADSGALLRTTNSNSRPTSRMNTTKVNSAAPMSACETISLRM